MSQSPAFQTAVEDSKKLTSKPGPNELLELYALFKVGTGEDFSKATQPGMFDLKASSPHGKAKYNAWKKAVEEDQLTPETAQAKYVELVEKLKEQYGYDANKVPETVGN
ncbi:acyl-CoA-binding protein (ACBP)/diazepam binding inhibitor (DBI)/endozepine (EP) [Fusarium torreyae]|uniref:Acyl-CoA-binding protein (ACBP)/diazepam binding inhibitor (DBI)/endozepine (EP) n=1 Tax=Fusarium torreyae TaxID=1237075 RepID=A0A9W8SE86_9HYPO|nr:acyl-CoA-binding protein (ACBP)/diazepam binding inhibitor (DBI)/endozepine (EP) [Fusarium torreyae]